MDPFKVSVVAQLAALKYVLESAGTIVFLAAELQPEHATAMRANAKARLQEEVFPGLEAVWSDHLAAEIAEDVDHILTNIEKGVTEAYGSLPPLVSDQA